MFNWLTVIILLPLDQIIKAFTSTGGYLYLLTKQIVNTIPVPEESSDKPMFLQVITKPFTNLILQVFQYLLNFLLQVVGAFRPFPCVALS